MRSKLKGYEAQCLLEREYEGRPMDALERAEYDFDNIVRSSYYNRYLVKKIK